MTLAVLYISAYLLGSIPFAVLLGRIKGIDVLKVGSGNPGMTNVGRALGRNWGIACFILDVCKSLVPTVIARSVIQGRIGPFDPQLIWFSVGLAAVLGHCASVFLRFRGGKGVSTALGAVLGATPLLGLSCFALFGILCLITRYVSLASVVGVSSAILFCVVLPGHSLQLLPIFIILSAFVAYRHRKNFSRIKNGTEPRVKIGKKAASSP